MTKVRVYGHSKGYGSWARVTAGYVEGLRAHDLLGGVHYIDADEEQELGAEPIAIYVGDPSGWERLVSFGDHRERWVVLAPNSTWMPPDLMRRLEKYATRVLATSRWAGEVLEVHTDLPTTVVGHGVDAGFSCLPDHPDQRASSTAFNVLHMTSTARQRKGTDELLEAWKDFHALVPGSRLVIIADYPNGPIDTKYMTSLGGVVEHIEGTGVFWSRRADLAPRHMGTYYRQFHCVCQPSRAEGFGMVPLEALAAGVPVVASACAGHLDYLAWRSEQPDGVVHVWPELEDGARLGIDDMMGPIDDGPEALAPVITPAAILKALHEMHDNWKTHARDAYWNAPVLAAKWSWPNMMRCYGLVDRIEETVK